VAGDPAAHELAERLEVALVAEVLLRAALGLLLLLTILALALGLDHAAEAGAHRIDEHQVGERQPRLIVRHEPGRHPRQRSVRRKCHPYWPDGAHVQERRRCTRATVEDEGHRTIAAALGDVGDREDLRRRLLLLAQHGPARARGVLERRARRNPGRRGLRPRRRLVLRLRGVRVIPGVVVGHGQNATSNATSLTSRAVERGVGPAR
jgi:hypothetical protein